MDTDNGGEIDARESVDVIDKGLCDLFVSGSWIMGEVDLGDNGE